MMDRENRIRTKKDTISVSIPPYLKAKLKEMVEFGDFSSVSEIITIAISEFIGKYEFEQKFAKPSIDDIDIKVTEKQKPHQDDENTIYHGEHEMR